jgi:CheY-like chemotaxis protein
MAGQTIQQCIDAETDQIMQSSASNIGSQNCSKRDIMKSGNTMTIDSVCSVAGRNATSHAVVTGSFDSAYTMTVASKSDVGPGINMTVAAKWLGPCQADQKPGDMIMPGGMTGRELAAELKKQKAGLKIIYTSGYSPGMAGRDASLVAERNFLPKPYSISKLAQFVRECLDVPSKRN